MNRASQIFRSADKDLSGMCPFFNRNVHVHERNAVGRLSYSLASTQANCHTPNGCPAWRASATACKASISSVCGA